MNLKTWRIWKTSVTQACKIMYFLSTYQGMQTTLQSSGLWRWLGGISPLHIQPYMAMRRLAIIKCWFSEEGGYKKSCFHCRAKLGTRVINDFGYVCEFLFLLWCCGYLSYYVILLNTKTAFVWPWTSSLSLYDGQSANAPCYEFRGKHEIKLVWQYTSIQYTSSYLYIWRS